MAKMRRSVIVDEDLSWLSDRRARATAPYGHVFACATPDRRPERGGHFFERAGHAAAVDGEKNRALRVA